MTRIDSFVYRLVYSHPAPASRQLIHTASSYNWGEESYTVYIYLQENIHFQEPSVIGIPFQRILSLSVIFYPNSLYSPPHPTPSFNLSKHIPTHPNLFIPIPTFFYQTIKLLRSLLRIKNNLSRKEVRVSTKISLRR